MIGLGKAFDNISTFKYSKHSMNVPSKLINIIKTLYRKSEFKVEMEGVESRWKQQATGIRQGCPLLPYLFIIIMSCLFHNIQLHDKVKHETAQNSGNGTRPKRCITITLPDHESIDQSIGGSITEQTTGFVARMAATCEN